MWMSGPKPGMTENDFAPMHMRGDLAAGCPSRVIACRIVSIAKKCL